MAKNKNVSLIIIGILLLIVICLGGIGLTYFLHKQDDKYIKTANEDDISRYEWMEMLCEQSGMTEYQNADPYYTDVDAGDSYFPYVQSAVEWNVLEDDKKFDGDDYASGRFVLITAMKSLGERKLKLYLDIEKSITNTVYIQTALEHNLLKEEELSQGISREAAERVLEQIANLQYTEFWTDDYERVEYQDEVVELIPDDILSKTKDGSEITVSASVLSNISEGTIIVYPADNSGMKAAKRVRGVDGTGKLTLTDNVEQDEVIESLVISDIIELTAQDIFNYYGLQEEYSADNMAYKQDSAGTMMPVWGASKEWEDKGFKIVVSVEEEKEDGKKYLEIEVTDNNTGSSITLPIKQAVPWDSGCQAELDVSKIYAAAHVEINHLGLEYAEAALDVQSTFKGGIKTEKSKESVRVKLIETPAPLGSGIAGVNIQVYLVASVEGEIFLEAELPANFCVKYDKKSGIRNEKVKQGEKKTEFKLNCEADFMLRIEPVLQCLLKNIMDVEADIGVAVEAEVNKRPIDMVCIDLAAACPVFTVSVSDDDNIKTLVGDTLGISAEWEIITAESAVFQKDVHVERTNNALEVVPECTYKEVNTYYTRYGEITQTDSPIFCFDYPDNWNISIEEVNGTPSGFEIFGDYLQEVVKLTNERGVMVTFLKIDDEIFEMVGRNLWYSDYSVEKTVDANFVMADGNASANFVVVKLTHIETLRTGTGVWDNEDEEAISYAIMQENIVDESEGSLLASGLLGYEEMLSFHYPTACAFYAASPDGTFTEEEEKEVIAILSSFREAD